MSLFGSLMGDMENDPFFGSHMRTMRHMNNMMHSLFGDPFDIGGGMGDFGIPALTFGGRAASQNSLLPVAGGYPFPNINRLLSNSLDSLGDSHCYSSSTVVSMTSGPDGRSHVYKATSSSRSVPGGLRETQKTVCDSRSGLKKMSIGHHIGERAHIVEREHNLHSGDQEERQDFINLEEEEAEDFNKEWETKTRSRSEIPRITGSSMLRNRHSYGDRYGREHHSGLPAITAGPSSRRSRDRHVNPLVSPRRGIRTNALALPSTSTSSARHPYSTPGHAHPKKNKNIKTVTGSPPPDM